MKRIGITLRVEVITSYNERRDCIDQNWVKLMLELGLLPILLPNIADPKLFNEYIQLMSLDGVVLTGGNDLEWTQSEKAASERDQFEAALIKHCIEHEKPVLGVCRGMQMLNVYLGGTLKRTDQHVRANHLVRFEGGRKFNVNSYHDWGIPPEMLANCLMPIGYSSDDMVELFKHQNLPITGMMWHPERSNQDHAIGVDIIRETFI